MIREQWEALTHGPRPPGCSHKQNKSNLKAKIWMDYWRLCSINMKNSGAASTLALLHGRPSYWLHGCFLVLGEAWMEGFQIVSLCFWNHSCGLKKKTQLSFEISNHLTSVFLLAISQPGVLSTTAKATLQLHTGFPVQSCPSTIPYVPMALISSHFHFKSIAYPNGWWTSWSFSGLVTWP